MAPSQPALHPTRAELDSLTAAERLKSKDHPTLPLRIYNYTESVQFKNQWTPTLIACRGLILDIANTGSTSGQVVARPMPKFGTFGDKLTRKQLPDLVSPGAAAPVDRGRRKVFDKLDGSLMILFAYREKWIVASRGSFDSPHAVEGAKILKRAGIVDERGTSARCDPRFTYVFELLAPEFRVRLDYGSRRELVLLAMIETATGLERINLEEEAAKLNCAAAPEVPGTDGESLENLSKRDIEGKEGYVVRWDDGTRLKIKFKTYLHIRFESGRGGESESALAERAVRDMCYNVPLEKTLEGVDDERFDEVDRARAAWSPKVDEYKRHLQALLDKLDAEAISVGAVKNRLLSPHYQHLLGAVAGIPMPSPQSVCRILALKRKNPGKRDELVAEEVWTNLKPILDKEKA